MWGYDMNGLPKSAIRKFCRLRIHNRLNIVPTEEDKSYLFSLTFNIRNHSFEIGKRQTSSQLDLDANRKTLEIILNCHGDGGVIIPACLSSRPTACCGGTATVIQLARKSISNQMVHLSPEIWPSTLRTRMANSNISRPDVTVKAV